MQSSRLLCGLASALLLILLSSVVQNVAGFSETEGEATERASFVRAAQLLQEGHFKQAENAFEHHIKKWKWSGGARSNLAIAYWRQNKFIDAYNMFEEALKYGGRDWQTRFSTGLLCTDLYQRWPREQKLRDEFKAKLSMTRKKLWTRAFRHIGTAQALDPEQVGPYRVIADLVEFKGQADKAANYLSQCITSCNFSIPTNEDEPTEADIQYRIATLYNEIGDKRATYHAKKAHDLGDMRGAWLELQLLMEHGHATHAAQVLDDLSNEYPEVTNTSHYLHYRGNVASMLGLSKQAISYYTRAMDPDTGRTSVSGDMLKNRGLEQNWMGDIDAAAKDLMTLWLWRLMRGDASWVLGQTDPHAGCERNYVRNLLDPAVKDITEITEIDVGDHGGEYGPGVPNVHESSKNHSFLEHVPPLTWNTPKDLFMASVRDVTVFGESMHLRTPCYALLTSSAILSGDRGFHTAQLLPVVRLPHPVVVPCANNNPVHYYHVLVEHLPRLIYMKEHVLDKNPEAKVLFPLEHKSLKTNRHVRETLLFDMLDLAGIPRDRVVKYKFSARQYEVSELHLIDWVPKRLEKQELQIMHYTPRVLIRNARAKLLQPDISYDERDLVIYVGRPVPGRRTVINEDILVDALKTAVEDRNLEFYHFDAPLPPSPDTNQTTLEMHRDLFRRARLVVGPHGEGLANIMWCAKDTAIVELPVVHGKENYYAHLAAAIGQTHYIVPDVISLYENQYDILPWMPPKVVETINLALDELETSQTSTLDPAAALDQQNIE